MGGVAGANHLQLQTFVDSLAEKCLQKAAFVATILDMARPRLELEANSLSTA
jgi:hypothetical protein